MSGAQLVWGALAPIVFVAIARIAWIRGIRSYSSASG
jgi:ABC-type uncharacterized transport system permease subunit